MGDPDPVASVGAAGFDPLTRSRIEGETAVQFLGAEARRMRRRWLSPQEGEALIFAAGPGGRARLVARVPVDGWSALAPVSR